LKPFHRQQNNIPGCTEYDTGSTNKIDFPASLLHNSWQSQMQIASTCTKEILTSRRAYKKLLTEEKCLPVKESLEDTQILQKPCTFKSSYTLRRIVCFWGWRKSGVWGWLLML